MSGLEVDMWSDVVATLPQFRIFNIDRLSAILICCITSITFQSILSLFVNILTTIVPHNILVRVDLSFSHVRA